MKIIHSQAVNTFIKYFKSGDKMYMEQYKHNTNDVYFYCYSTEYLINKADKNLVAIFKITKK